MISCVAFHCPPDCWSALFSQWAIREGLAADPPAVVYVPTKRRERRVSEGPSTDPALENFAPASGITGSPCLDCFCAGLSQNVQVQLREILLAHHAPA